MKSKRMIIILASIVAVVTIVVLLIYNPSYFKTLFKQCHKYTWPETEAASLLPEPKSKKGWIEISNEDELLMEVYKTSKKDFLDYCIRCRSCSFDLYTVSEDDYRSAYDWKGNYLEVAYDYKNKMMRVHMYESEEHKLLKGIEHLEFGYTTEYKWSEEYQRYYTEYDEAISKYLTPQKTTVGELKKDFPLEEKKCISVVKSKFYLEDDKEIWVYATCYDNCESATLKFTYDELKIKQDELIIRTHFDVLKQECLDMPEEKGIVISLIPVDQ